MNQFFLPIFLHKCRKTGKTSLQFVFLHDIVESTISRWSLQENGSDFTLSKPTEGVKLSGVRRADRTMGGCGSGESRLTGYRRWKAAWPLNLSGKRTEKILRKYSVSSWDWRKKGFPFGAVSFYSQHRIFAILYSIMLWTISVCAADISFFRRINQSGTLPFLFSRVIPNSFFHFETLSLRIA